MSEYGHAFAKITIAGHDEDLPGVIVEAQYNPKELQVDRTVPWAPTGETNNGNTNQASSQNMGIHLEFTGAQGRTLTVELLFDGYEEQATGKYKVNVAKRVSDLEKLASVIKPNSDIAKERTPPRCIVVWGTTMQSFRCVIESLSTKYTMFSAQGDPLRATCTVKLKEVDTIGPKKGGGGGGGGGTSAGGGGGSGGGGSGGGTQ